MPRSLRWIVLVALVVPGTSAGVQTSTLGAYPTGKLSSHSPWFNYRLQPGQDTEGSITVDNRSATGQDVILYGVDASPIGDGGFGMKPQAAHPKDAGGWIRLTDSTLHLAPQSQQNVLFKLRVPPHASVGPHYAGIVIQPSHVAVQSQPHTSLQIVTRLGVRMYIEIPGRARPKLSIDSLQPDANQHKIGLTATLHNGGNTLLTPTGSLKLTPIAGRATTQGFNAGGSLEPSDQLKVRLPTSITAGGFPHRYTAQLSLRYGVPPHYQMIHRTVTFWTGNVRAWLTGLILLMLTAAGWTMKYCTNHHRNRHKGNQG